MARSYNGTTDQISYGSAANIDNIFDGGGTWACWALHNAGQGNGDRVLDKFESAASGPRFVVNPDHAYQLGFEFTTGFGRWDTTETTTQDVYSHIGLKYNADAVTNDPTIFYDGVSATINELITPTGTRKSDAAQSFRSGGKGSTVQTWSGSIAEITVWTTEIPDVQIAAIARGVPAFLFDNANLVLYSPSWGNESPEADYKGQDNKGTLDGTAKSNHPAVEMLENYL